MRPEKDRIYSKSEAYDSCAPIRYPMFGGLYVDSQIALASDIPSLPHRKFRATYSQVFLAKELFFNQL